MRIPRQALFDGLRTFSVAARLLSFKAAADALHVSPSAISHRIRELELHIGQHVFVRKTRAVELTEVGRSLLEEVEPLLASLDAALEGAEKRTRRRVLRIAAPPFIATELLIPRPSSFYGLQRRIDLQISSSEPHPSEHPRGADVSIVIAPEAPTGAVAIKLFSPRFVATTSRSHALEARELGPRVFDKQRRIIYRRRADLWQRWFASTGIPAGRAAAVIEVDTLPAAIGAAECGIGIALVPSFVVEWRLRSGRLLRIADAEIESGDTYFLVHRQADRLRPEIRAFLSWAITELRR